MLNSMTGYGRVKQEGETTDILVEIRSVNHRYLDLNIKVPRIYAFLEDKIKTSLSAALARGKVDIFLSIRVKDGKDIKITPNMPVIDGYMRAIAEIADRHAVCGKVSALELVKMPDALSVEKEEADAEIIATQAMTVLQTALAEYNAMRKQEGEKLCQDIEYRAGLIAQLVDSVENRSPNSVSEYRQRIKERMEELLDNSEIAEQRILTEAAIFADKVSVTEEIVRLKSHLGQLHTMLKSKTAVGRKLDFLVQELNREANTIGSKANDFEITKTVIDIKSEIEKIREQVQNLE